MIKKLISIIIAALIVQTSFLTSARADELNLPEVPSLELDEPSVGEAISPMKRGQRAPFTGILFSPEAVAKVTVELNNVSEQIKLNVQRAIELRDAQNQYKINEITIKAEAEKAINTAELSTAVQENLILSERIKKLEDNQSNTIWYVGGGFLAGTVVTVLVVLATSLAK